jgi:hypothetical protein
MTGKRSTHVGVFEPSDKKRPSAYDEMPKGSYRGDYAIKLPAKGKRKDKMIKSWDDLKETQLRHLLHSHERDCLTGNQIIKYMLDTKTSKTSNRCRRR